MMAAGNPNWWSKNGMHPQLPSQLVYGSTSPVSSNPNPADDQEFPVRSWSQLLLGGLGGGGGEEESVFQQQKKVENWDDQLLSLDPSFARVSVADVKPGISQSTNSQIYSHVDDEFQANPWAPRQHPASSPTSCITSLSNNFLSFSSGKPAPAADRKRQHHSQNHSSECNSTGTGVVSKKARIQSSSQPALKVRKEKLGDRITALHQLVSPFGKTDTASVLSEAIGYIRFLQGQIEALSSPYMRNGSGSTGHPQQHSVQERECLFFEKSPQDPQGQSGVKDLRSRGLCLVPVSCTHHVGCDTGADYWAPEAFGGGF